VDLKTYQRETVIHRRVYEGLREHLRREHAGKYVALGQGQVIAITNTYDEASAAVNRLHPVPEYYLIFPAEMDPPFELAYDF
jgi:hypothetical protein